jgi:amino acid transporter
MIEKYFLNTRGQVRLWIIAVSLLFCHFISFAFHLPTYYEHIILPAILISLSLAVGHIILLTFLNYFFRHPIVRYTLLSVAFELILVVGFMLIWLIFNTDRIFSFTEFVDFYTRVHTMWETWYFIITPSIVVVVSAMFIEFKAGQYYCVEVLKKKSDNNILDDIL